MRIMMIAVAVWSLVGCGEEKAKGGKAPATDAAQTANQQQSANATANQQEIDRLRAENTKLQQELAQLKQQQISNTPIGGVTATGASPNGLGSGLGAITGLLGGVPGLQGCMQSLMQNFTGGGSLQNIDLQKLGSGCTGIFNQVAGATTR